MFQQFALRGKSAMSATFFVDGEAHIIYFCILFLEIRKKNLIVKTF